MIVHERDEQSQLQIQQSTKSAEWQTICVYQQVLCYGNGYNDKNKIQQTQGTALILI